MRARKIKPINGKKELSDSHKESKIAKAEYINFKINENKKLQLDRGNYVVYKPNFLGFKKRHLAKVLQEAGFNSRFLEEMNICTNDINYFIEVESYFKQNNNLPFEARQLTTYIKEINKLDKLTENKRQEIQKRTLHKLEISETNQYGIRQTKKVLPQIQRLESIHPLTNPCISCNKKEIDILYSSCGHACCCFSCESKFCQICKESNTGTVRLQG